LRCKKIAGSRNRTKDALQYVIANSCHAVHYSTVQYLVPAQLEAQHRSNCEVGSGALGVDKVSPAHHQWSVLCNTVPSTRPEHHQYSKSLYSAVPERHLFITSAPPVHHQHLTIHHQYIASRASNNTVVTSTSPVHNTVQHVPDAASQVHHQYNTAQYCTSTARHHCIISTVLYTTCASPVQYISSTPPVHHQHITSTSPVHRQRITSASPVHHQYITSTSTVHHQCITSTPPVHHQYITSASPAHRQPVHHQYITSTPPIQYSTVQCITSTSLLHHQICSALYITRTSPVQYSTSPDHHYWITPALTSTVHHQHITSTSPLRHQH
jgi:hypothetical protein